MYHLRLGNPMLAGSRFVIATSPQEAAELATRGVGPEKIIVRRNGVEVPAALPERGKFRSKQGIAADAKLVLFRDAVQSACGFAQAVSGPFYCPNDRKVYIDLGFYNELRSRFGAPGDFAQAYVLAHEVGHHVQTLLGDNFGSSNAGSVRRELQADCYAGIWGSFMAREGVLEPGDVEEGIGAAAAVGDDRLQRQSTGTVSPETFTHGTSAQRVSWFLRGLESGRVESCQT
jgi:predicted metalloprotease